MAAHIKRTPTQHNPHHRSRRAQALRSILYHTISYDIILYCILPYLHHRSILAQNWGIYFWDRPGGRRRSTSGGFGLAVPRPSIRGGHQRRCSVGSYLCNIVYYTILYYTILYYTILYYTVLYYTILYYTILYYTILYYTILYCTILYYTVLYCTILYYTIHVWSCGDVRVWG